MPDIVSYSKAIQKLKNKIVLCAFFGKSNQNKNGRYSWSGKVCPKVSVYNQFGQILSIETNKDIVARYSYSKDQRENKSIIVPKKLQQENLVIARWYSEYSPSTKKTDKCLKEKLEDKFNNHGWFTCKMNSKGEYCKICFGKNIDYEVWLSLVKDGIVFFDSGMHEGNARPYSQWRANNDF